MLASCNKLILDYTKVLIFYTMDMPTEFSVVNDGGDSEHHRLARHLLHECMAWCTHMFPKLIFCHFSSRDDTSFMLANRCLIHMTHHFSTWDGCFKDLVLVSYHTWFVIKYLHCVIILCLGCSWLYALRFWVLLSWFKNVQKQESN